MRYVGPRRIVIDDNPAPVPFWEPSPWGEATAVIIGGGPSHVAIPADAYRAHRFVAVNSACRHVAPIATANDILYFSDNSWADRFEHLIRTWPGLVVTSNRNTKARLGALVNRLNFTAVIEYAGASPDYVGASSGHTAACLAAMMGATRLVLIGFEGGYVNGRSHGHTDYVQHDEHAFRERFLPGWSGLAPAFLRLGVEVLNATPQSAVTDFPAVDFAEAT
tara:strand:- start:4240 stop:4902 length:663 start_codon:yes stop_codon:yes gene_type:complete